jgi:hypothetical protein
MSKLTKMPLSITSAKVLTRGLHLLIPSSIFSSNASERNRAVMVSLRRLGFAARIEKKSTAVHRCGEGAA